MIKTFNKWFKLVNNCDVADFVDLMETLHAVLDQLSQIHSRLDGVGDALDDDGVILSIGSVEEVPCSLQVSANADTSSNSDFVRW